jgi:hypothetical protein
MRKAMTDCASEMDRSCARRARFVLKRCSDRSERVSSLRSAMRASKVASGLSCAKRRAVAPNRGPKRRLCLLEHPRKVR